MKKCPKCGCKIRSGSTYCTNCGVRLASGKFLKKKKHTSYKKFRIILVCVIVLLTGMSMAFFVQNKEEKDIVVQDVEAAISFLKESREDYGYNNALSELTEKHTSEIDGDRYYRLQQNYRGVPVLGRTTVLATNEAGEVISVTGNLEDIDDDIKIIPTITAEEINEVASNYHPEEIGSELFPDVSVEVANSTLCIYKPEIDEQYLVYEVYVKYYADTLYNYRLIIDAHSGDILSAYSTLRDDAAIGYRASDTMRQNGFTVTRLDDGRFALINESQNLVVYDLQRNNSSKVAIGGDGYVSSSNNIFGDDPQTESTHEIGTYLLHNTAMISEYFNTTVGFATQSGITVLCYNDNYTFGRNARGGLLGEHGFVSMGHVTGTNDIDVIAHEYGHVMSFTLVSWNSKEMQTQAINEGLSDIFGEIAEAKIADSDTPDWIMTGSNVNVKRNMQSPNDSGNAAHVDDSSLWDKYWQDEEYYYSTVISHAAYLMWNGIDGEESQRIGIDQLTKLWYRAMLMMPSDCDFSTCRQIVEWAALSVDGLSDAQRECISEAFDAVGMYHIELDPEILVDCDYNVRPSSVLNVYDIEGDLHQSYTLNITGTIAERELSYSSSILTDLGFHYNKTVEIEKPSSYRLDLPDGYYTFTIEDKNNPQYTYSFTVSVGENGTDDMISLYTDFKDQLIVRVTEETNPIDNTEFIETEEYKQLVKAYTRLSDSFTEEYVYSYNDAGQLIKRTNTSYNNGSKTFAYDWLYLYDSSGRMIAEKDSNSNYNDYEYHYDGNLLTGSTYNDIREDKIVISTTYHFERDAAGNVVSVTTNGTDPDVWKKGKYSYDGEGHRISGDEEEKYGDHYFERKFSYDYSYPGMIIITKEETMFDFTSTSRFIQMRDFEKNSLGTFELLDGYSIKTDKDGYITEVVDAKGTIVHTFEYNDGEITKSTHGSRYDKNAVTGYEQAVRYLENEIVPNYVIPTEKMTATYYCQTYGGMAGQAYATTSTSNLYTLSQIRPWLIAYNIADYNSDRIADLFIITLEGYGKGEIGQAEIKRRIYMFDENGQATPRALFNTAASASQKKMVFAFIDDKLVELSFSDYSMHREGDNATLIEYPITDKLRYHDASINVKQFNPNTNELEFILSFYRHSYPNGNPSWGGDYDDYKTEYDAMLAVQDLLHENYIWGVEMPISDIWANRWNDDFYLTNEAEWNAFEFEISSSPSEIVYGVELVGGPRYDEKGLLNTTTGTTVFKWDKYELS